MHWILHITKTIISIICLFFIVFSTTKCTFRWIFLQLPTPYIQIPLIVAQRKHRLLLLIPQLGFAQAEQTQYAKQIVELHHNEAQSVFSQQSSADPFVVFQLRSLRRAFSSNIIVITRVSPLLCLSSIVV